jgi:hypothetical protein
MEKAAVIREDATTLLDRARLPAPPSSSEGAESGAPASQLLEQT